MHATHHIRTACRCTTPPPPIQPSPPPPHCARAQAPSLRIAHCSTPQHIWSPSTTYCRCRHRRQAPPFCTPLHRRRRRIIISRRPPPPRTPPHTHARTQAVADPAAPPLRCTICRYYCCCHRIRYYAAIAPSFAIYAAPPLSPHIIAFTPPPFIYTLSFINSIARTHYALNKQHRHRIATPPQHQHRILTPGEHRPAIAPSPQYYQSPYFRYTRTIAAVAAGTIRWPLLHITHADTIYAAAHTLRILTPAIIYLHYAAPSNPAPSSSSIDKDADARRRAAFTPSPTPLLPTAPDNIAPSPLHYTHTPTIYHYANLLPTHSIAATAAPSHLHTAGSKQHTAAV